jgi:Type I phosphodiesterase / nucleotide pyrophosphatase
MRPLLLLGLTILSVTLASIAFAQAPAARPHNVVLFVADGLRFRIVDDHTAPTTAALAREGVTLRNSHALFPTFTTANASSMATGHMLGDTGDFSNTIYAGFEVPGAAKSQTPFLENDAILGDIDEHFSGNYLNEATILKLARDKARPPSPQSAMPMTISLAFAPRSMNSACSIRLTLSQRRTTASRRFRRKARPARRSEPGSPIPCRDICRSASSRWISHTLSTCR